MRSMVPYGARDKRVDLLCNIKQGLICPQSGAGVHLLGPQRKTPRH